jgi:exodeoxyribonuclease V alpha subunit
MKRITVDNCWELLVMHGGVKVYRGTASAARTYLDTEGCRVDDYYLREGAGVAQHLTVDGNGHVIERAGLSGERYEAWVAGLDPDTGEPRGQLRGDGHAVRFLEIVVNGPKSWSLAAELHDDVAAAYEAAQDRAARQILAWLGEHATTRVGPRGQQVAVPVQRLEAAVIRHYTSRAGDPHRHLHLQVNARVFAAGKWRGLDTVAVRDSIQALNGIGHAAVACDPDFRAALAAHGYTLTPDGEIGQLAPFVGSFSTRAAQIGRLLDRYEAAWRAEHPGREPGPGLRRAWDARAWAQDRPDKVVPRDGGELRQRWRAELAELGYRDRDKPVQLALPLPGAVDRDAAAVEVIARLGARHSAWNGADVRGEVEQLLARAAVIAQSAVRGELAEDLTARAIELCTPLTTQDATPEHVRALTSRRVLDVEADLVGRFASRGAGAVTPVEPASSAELDDGQRLAVAALSGDAALVVIEGAAGAGKTTTLAATREALSERGARLVVVTPTRKAAHAASVEIGTQTGSAAWLAWQHGWRWDEHGTWARQPAHPGPDAALQKEDLLLCDEAGMLDQDTARALLTLADEAGARIALVGDRHQLPAVGRGGVLDLALRWCQPAARVDLDTVHRFVHTIDGQLVPDEEYAALSLQMRTGDDPVAVFDALLERGQIALYPSEIDRQDALAAQIAAARRAGDAPTVMVDTRDHADTLNTAIREQLITAGHVDDQQVAVTSAGQRIGAGDLVVTRRNDAHRDIANREAWTVTRVHSHGQLTITDPHRGTRQLPPEYVHEYLELGYASTGYGIQGDTTSAAHLILTDTTTAASAYVAMTRGRHADTAHLVAADIDDAREQWIAAFSRDRADLGAAAARAAAERAAAGCAPARLLDQVLAALRQAWTAEADGRDWLARAERTRDLVAELAALTERRAAALAPVEDAYTAARVAHEQASAAADRLDDLVTAQASEIAAALQRDWERQREPARHAAATVHAGPGRFGQRIGRVNRATEELARWAVAWQPYLPAMPTGSDDIARFAAQREDPAGVAAVFAEHARAAAENAHPERAHARAAAEAAALRREQAARACTETAQPYNTAIVGYGRLTNLTDPAAALSELEEGIAVVRDDIAETQQRVATLRAEPALRDIPPEQITAAHHTWQRHRELRQQTKRVRGQLGNSGLDRRLHHNPDHDWSPRTPDPSPKMSR